LMALAGTLVAGIPFGFFLIPSGVFADVAALFPHIPLKEFVKLWEIAAGSVLRAMKVISSFSFSFIYLSWAGCLAVTLTGISGLFVWRSRNYRICAGMVIFLVIVSVAAGVQMVSESMAGNIFFVDFPGLNQADAAIIRYRGVTVLIDCGPPGPPGRDSPIVRALKHWGIREIDAIFLTHPHPDHTGGVTDVMVKWPVKAVYLPAESRNAVKWKEISRAAIPETRVEFIRYRDVVQIELIKVMVMGPEDRVTGTTVNVNDSSLQLLLDVHGYRALFTGDASWSQVYRSLAMIKNLDLFKVPHHGSGVGFPPADLDEVMSMLNSNGKLKAVCPSLPPGVRILPAPVVVEWFENRNVEFVYTGAKGIKIRSSTSAIGVKTSAVIDNHGMF